MRRGTEDDSRAWSGAVKNKAAYSMVPREGIRNLEYGIEILDSFPSCYYSYLLGRIDSMPKLVVQLGGQEWTVDLKPGPNVVGRQSTCSIPLKDPSLSRQHCELVVEGQQVTMVDKGSMNGTLVNGKRVPSQVLVPGDKITLGQAVLWFEKKNVAVESRPATARAAPAADPSVQSQVATRRSLAAVSAPATASVALAQGPAPVPDFAVRVRSGGPWLKIVAAAAVLAALGVGAFMARGLFKSDGVVVVDDRDNVLAKTSGFDRTAGGRPEGWALREKGATALGADLAQGRSGACMVLEKSGQDLVVEAVYGEDFVLGNTSLVEAEVHARFENFSGWAAFKIDWLREPKGPVVAEEYSDLVSKAAQWTPIRCAFTPPSGVRAFRVGLAAIGRTGRIFFDDVSVKRRSGPGAAAEHKLGIHVVRSTRHGVLQVVFKGRQALSNVGLRLESEKEGAIPQASALQVSVTPQQDLLIFTGRMLNPVDFREIEFEEQVAHADGATVVVWRFKGVELRQVDRVSVQLGLPQVDSVQGLPESPDQPVLRLVCQAGEGDFVIEANELVRVREQQVQGRRKLTLTYAVDSQQEELVFGFSVRTAAAGGPLDPEKEGGEDEKAGRSGKALSLYRDFLPKVKDAAQHERVELRIRALEEAEKRELEDVQSLAFQADLSGRADPLRRAQEALDAYLLRWKGANVEGKTMRVREVLKRQGEISQASEAERPRKILEQAKKLLESGKRSVAEAMLRTLLSKYPSSEAAAEARQLLGTLDQ